MTFVIVDRKTGRVMGKPYDRLRNARLQANRLNKSAGWLWRFVVEERP